MIKAEDIRDLVEISHLVGRDLLLAQGGGGNTSVKSADGKRMWVKASGLRLSEVNEDRGYVEMELPELVALVRDSGEASQPRAVAHEAFIRNVLATSRGTGLRPSLEAGMHAVFEQRVVLHTHPVYTNAVACMVDGEDAVLEASGEKVAWVPYEPPGYALAVEVDRSMIAFRRAHGREPDVTMLGNHGLITSRPTVPEAFDATTRIVNAARDFFGPLPPDACDAATPPGALIQWAEGLERALKAKSPAGSSVVRPTERSALLEAASDFDRWLAAGPIVPDDVVYLGRKIWEVDDTQSPEAWLESEGETLPERAAIAVTGLGIVLVGPNDRSLEAMEENLLAHVLILRLITRKGRVRPLPQEAVDYLISMESEAYRQSVAAAGGDTLAGPHRLHRIGTRERRQPLDQLRMAAHWGPDHVANTVEAPDVVSVAVVDDDRRHSRLAQLLVGVKDLPRPFSVLLAGIYQDHLVLRVADEVDVSPSGMKGVGVVDVQPVNVRGYLFQDRSSSLTDAARWLRRAATMFTGRVPQRGLAQGRPCSAPALDETTLADYYASL